MTAPAYDLRVVTRDDVLELFERYHAYGSLSNSLTYGFAIYELGKPVAAFAWQPPPVGAAKALSPNAPAGVLSLSRMVAVPEKERTTRLRNPLKKQMRSLIDRGRWPVLVTYSDEGQGHTGYIYKITGWTPTTKSTRPIKEDKDGARRSSYSNGKHGTRDLVDAGTTVIQRWEHRACPAGAELEHMTSHGWRRVAIPGKVWASGRPAHTWVRDV